MTTPAPPAHPSGPAWARMVASFAGTGFAPMAPGTAGSLACLPLGALLLERPLLLLLAVAVVCVVGIVAIRRASGGADHGWIVIDEVAGQWITLLGLAGLPALPALHGLVLAAGVSVAFLLFRLLDITKPGAIGRIDRRHDALGVMGDDILAGVVGATILLGARVIWGWAR